MEEKLIRINKVQELVSLCRTQIYSEIKKQKFPPPRKPTIGTSVWIYSEVQEYINCIKEGKPWGKGENNV